MTDHTYLYCRWRHNDVDYPVEIWSELDGARWEMRKVERWPDGRVGYADEEEEVGGTGLATLPVPSIDEIADQYEFDPVEITREEFETHWAARKR